MSKDKQTTPMKLLVKELNKIKRHEYTTPTEAILIAGIVGIIKSGYIKMEREIIENAFVAGDERGTKDIPFNAEQYYNQTFK